MGSSRTAPREGRRDPRDRAPRRPRTERSRRGAEDPGAGLGLADLAPPERRGLPPDAGGSRVFPPRAGGVGPPRPPLLGAGLAHARCRLVLGAAAGRISHGEGAARGLATPAVTP